MAFQKWADSGVVRQTSREEKREETAEKGFRVRDFATYRGYRYPVALFRTSLYCSVVALEKGPGQGSGAKSVTP